MPSVKLGEVSRVFIVSSGVARLYYNARPFGCAEVFAMDNIINRLLTERGVLLADGATGSNLFALGLLSGDSPELWNAQHPERITRHYQSFIDAGADLILTNTFGGTRHRLKRHDAADRVDELNRAGAHLARQCADAAPREVIVAGSMGPSGEILQPLGDLTHEQAVEAFAEQARALKRGGVDVLWIETMSSHEEIAAAVEGGGVAGLPMVATFSMDTNGRTMMGLAPADIVELSLQLAHRPIAIGANCGVGASELVAAIVNMQHACTQAAIEPLLVAKANCGVPHYVEGKIVYDGDAHIMSEYTKLAIDAGAKIIGGCCGTTPSHLRAMRRALDHHRREPSPTLEVIERRLGEVSAGAKAQLRGELSVAAGAVRPREARRNRRNVGKGDK